MPTPHLGVNLDHVATVRQARGTVEPDPVAAAVLAELAGADSITIHLREDRRHIQDRDAILLRQTIRTRLNLEMALTPEMQQIALDLRPHQVTLVPEKRQELTTEGGLDVHAQRSTLAKAIAIFHEAQIPVALFIDPDPEQIQASHEVGAFAVELHTGAYADPHADTSKELQRLQFGSEQVLRLGMKLHAGHGLTYWNVGPIAVIPGMSELNIGHSIIARAVLVGMERAVREMKFALQGTSTPDR